MSIAIDEVLKKLGWENGFQIPIANADNHALEEEVARLSLKRVKTVSKCKNTEARCEALKSHLKYVNQESDQNQKLILTHKQQLDTENEKLFNVKHEKINVDKDIKEIDKKILELNDKHEHKKIKLEKTIVNVDKLKAETDWDTEALKAWEESLKKRDEDNKIINKFSIEDERKYNELEAKRQNLQIEHVSRTESVQKMNSEIEYYERVMERTGKIINQQNIEKELLINQWKDTVKQLQQRDNEIAQIQVDIVEVQEIIDKQLEILDEQNNFFENEKNNNRSLLFEIEERNVLYSRIRREFNEIVHNTTLMKNELGTLSQAVNGAAKLLQNERIKSKSITQSIEEKEIKTEEFYHAIEKLKQKLEDIQKNSKNAALRNTDLEKMIDYEQLEMDSRILELERLQTVLFRTDNKLMQQILKNKEIVRENQNLNNIIIQLRKRNYYDNRILEKNKEVAYEIDFRIDQVEKVLHDRDSNSKFVVEDEIKNNRSIELEEKVTQCNEVCNLIQDQINKIHEEMRRITTSITLDKDELETLKDKCEHQMIIFDIGQKQVANFKESCQEKQVEECIIRLRITGIEKNVTKEDKDIFSLTKLRLNLDQVMKERQLEINTAKTILLAKRRNLYEDRGRIKADMSIRRCKVEQYQKKYHLAIIGLGTDDDGEPISITSVQIKNAQEKYLLQQEGDNLDEKIKKSEKEIIAMENTLKVVNASNSSFRQSLTIVSEQDEYVKALKELEDEYFKVHNICKEYKYEIAKQKRELQESQNISQEAIDKREEEKQKIVDLEEELVSVQKQEDRKSEQLERAKYHLKRAAKKLTRAGIQNYERDFDIRQIRDANKSVLVTLQKMSENLSDVHPKIQYYLILYDVQLPQGKVSPSLSSSTFSELSSIHSETRNRGGSTNRSSISQQSTSSSVNKVNLSLNL